MGLIILNMKQVLF